MQFFSLSNLASRADENEFHIRWLAGGPEGVGRSKPHGFKIVFPIIRANKHYESSHAVLGAHRAQEVRIVSIREPIIAEDDVDRMAHQHFPSVLNGWTGVGVDRQSFHNLPQSPFGFNPAGDNE